MTAFSSLDPPNATQTQNVIKRIKATHCAEQWDKRLQLVTEFWKVTNIFPSIQVSNHVSILEILQEYTI